MELEIITPDEVLFQGEARLVQLPGTDGSFEILSNHAPIISTLKQGNIRVVKPDNEELQLPIRSGVVEMQGSKVIVLAEK